ncbi:MAG: putative DNA modification/repair radical SAM protein [Eubacteriaceae bacterium]|nr:putative DNA modification/repair radical SAM protein [Eubacteriaceae bacterium]
MDDNLMNKLAILAEGAKYDVSCSSSGVERLNNGKGIGNARGWGICHTWSADGRCVSLLKLLMTNSCVYDCSYCVNRLSNDVPRASMSPEEIAMLTMEFYRRNYIEGLFLSSAIEKTPDDTMEKMYRTLDLLRNVHQYNGYIHIKAIPGASSDLIRNCGYLADRMSVNIELPSRESLKLLAPQKSFEKIMPPIENIRNNILLYKDERKSFKKTPKFVPGGQSTQVIIGATPDTDRSILSVSEKLYSDYGLKRVYYSAYMPVNEGPNLPSLFSAPPLLREHRLYQADWLLRFYDFSVKELFAGNSSSIDSNLDPKLNWALNNLHLFPVEINKAPLEMLIRVPGIGHISASRIIRERRVNFLDFERLKKTGCVFLKAKYFVTCKGKYDGESLDSEFIRRKLLNKMDYQQISFLG